MCECMRRRRTCVLQTSVEGMRNTCRGIISGMHVHTFGFRSKVSILFGENAPSLYIVLCCSISKCNPFFETSSRLSSLIFARSRERGILLPLRNSSPLLFFSYPNARARKHKLFSLNICVYMYMLLYSVNVLCIEGKEYMYVYIACMRI